MEIVLCACVEALSARFAFPREKYSFRGREGRALCSPGIPVRVIYNRVLRESVHAETANTTAKRDFRRF